jgi:protein O-mannosyl-transferase
MEDREWKSVFWRGMAHPLVACALLVGATTIPFWPVTHAGFINYDDPEYVTDNPRVQAGLSWSGIGWALTTHYASNWHPLTWISHMLDLTLFGEGAVGPHCVNLFLHTLNSVLLFLCLRRMSGAHWRSFLVAALFALHPLHVESVAWVTERKDVLSAFWFMLTLLAYARYAEVQSRKSRAQGQEPASRFTFHLSLFYLLSLLFFALGLLSKPMLVTVPFVLLLLDYWPLGRIQKDEWRRKNEEPGPAQHTPFILLEKLPFFLLSAISCGLTLLAQHRAMAPLARLSLSLRAENALVAYGRYLGKAFWPADLAIPYPHPTHWPAEKVALAAVMVLGLCVVAWWGLRRWPFVFTGWFWFVGTLIPVIGVVQVGNQAMADRYTYVPLIGILVIVTWGCSAVCGLGRREGSVAGALAAVAVLTACGVMTRRQAGYWHDTERLFRHVAAVSKDNYTALGNIAAALFARGEYDVAIAYCRKALAIKPDYADGLNNLGAALEKQGRAESMEEYRKALRISPGHSGALYNMGNALLARGRPAEAADCFEAVLQVKPDNFEARNNLANALLSLGRGDEAIAQYRLALSRNPSSEKVLKNLGAALVKKGKLDEATVYYRRALKVSPKDGLGHYALGLALALQAKWDEAIEHYTATVRLAPPNPEVEYNLGYAFRMSGRLPEAVVHLNEALRLRPKFPLAQYNLACVLAQQGQRDEAVTHLTEALREQPDYPEARQKLGELDAGGKGRDGK